jgi:putative transposase
MKKVMAYKSRLRPTAEQRVLLGKIAGHNRFVWNRALALNKEGYAEGYARLRARLGLSVNDFRLSHFDISRLLTDWKQEPDLAFLQEAPRRSYTQTLRNLERAYKDGFSSKQPNKRLPVFKAKGRARDSFSMQIGTQAKPAFKVKGNRIRLPMLGWMRFYKSREIVGVMKNATVSRSGKHWDVSIQVEQEVPDPVHPHPKREIGVDMGIASTLTTSDGTHHEMPSLDALDRRIRHAQRAASRKKKHSANWRKACDRVAHLKERQANIRRDFQQKTTTALIRNHGLVAIEDLNVRGMTKSAKGTVEEPGKNVAAKAGLNRRILEQGWGEQRRMLEYKAKWAGGELIAVNAAGTSRTCSVCGYEAAENRTTQSRFKCKECGHTENADENAAKNILKRARHARIACGEGRAKAPSVKQEPSTRRKARLA